MALIVEDGTGKADAQSFVSVSEADTYHEGLGNTGWDSPNGESASTEDKEKALRRASRFLSDSFKWKGYPVNGRDQNLAWPRFYVSDDEDYGIDSDEIPIEVKRATYEIALLELVTPGTMTPTVTESQRVKREKVGPLEVEYLATRTDAWADRPVVTKVIDMISPLLRAGARNRLVGKAVRS
jgi:hypothetical protein